MNYAKTCLFSALILFAGLVPVSHSMAQGPTKVALVDIGMVFKSHPSFSKQLADLKTEADQFKAESATITQKMMERADTLRKSGYQPGSDQYKQMESELAQEAAKIEVEQKSKLRDLMSREASLHYDTYQQVGKIIREYCTQRNIQLVLRYNSQQMDPSQPQSIMDKVNGSVVYFAPGKDVTEAIIAQVQQAGTSIK